MEAQTSVAKVCTVCGTDVSAKKRVKDAPGRYFCSACYQAAAVEKTASDPNPEAKAPNASFRTAVTQKHSGAEQPPVARTVTSGSKRVVATKRPWLMVTIAIIPAIGGIATWKVVSDRNAARNQARQVAEAARIGEQAKADLAKAERLRAEQVQRDLETKQAEERAKEEAARNDPAKLFESFSSSFMEAVAQQITSSSYICKVDDKYSIGLNRTSSLLSPDQGVIEGGVLTRYKGKPNDASTPVRLTFGFQNGTWVLAALESKTVEVFDGPYGREIHSTPWQLSIDLNGFEGVFKTATDRANSAIRK